jgi:carboxypeptidase C (cathepsin A)
MLSKPFYVNLSLATLILALAAAGPAHAREPVIHEPHRAVQSERGAIDADEASETSKHETRLHAPGAASKALPGPATTDHRIDLPGRSLAFTATAGAIRLSDAEKDTPQADVAYVAFILKGAEASHRPVTFAINGGPGASSAWLNLGALGPWRLPIKDPSAPPLTVDNAETWLDFTDLVFIDPPGTGYSRFLGKSDDGRRRFYSISGDIEALAVVIRKWLVANGRLASPKFIVGESYGGFRAPKLARRLADIEGIGVSGLILISPVLDFGWFEGEHNPMTYVTRLPSQAAAARGRTNADGRAGLADVEAYAAGPYLVDLLRGKRDSAALARISEKVASFTKLDPALVKKFGGRIDIETFSRERMRAEGLVSSPYDAKITGLDPEPYAATSNAPDPVLDAVKPQLASAMADLTTNRLRWPVEGRYEILNNRVNRAWDWGSGRSRPEALGDLKYVLALDRDLRAQVVHGVTDLVTPYFGSKLLIEQVPPLGDPSRLRLDVVPGGHMFYFEDASRASLREGARRLIESK